MEKITHEKDREGNVRVSACGEANGTPYFYQAILVQKTDDDGKSFISESDINTYGIEDPLLKEQIIDTVQKEKGKHGEPPLIVDEENKKHNCDNVSSK